MIMTQNIKPTLIIEKNVFNSTHASLICKVVNKLIDFVKKYKFDDDLDLNNWYIDECNKMEGMYDFDIGTNAFRIAINSPENYSLLTLGIYNSKLNILKMYEPTESGKIYKINI